MRVVEPVIRLIAKTVPVLDELEACEPLWYDGLDNTSGQAVIEFAGRECYQSWNRPNPATQTNAGYVESLIMQRHFSVLEHASATFRFQNISRSQTHELVRHRHFSYSQLSQRYVDSGEELVISVHPEVQALVAAEYQDGGEGNVNHFIDERLDDLDAAVSAFYKEVDTALEMKRKNIKQRRGAARGALMNMTATNIVVTGNLRAWRHFILMRSHVSAELEIRLTAWKVYVLLSAHFPAAFMDFVQVPVLNEPAMLTTDYREAE
jgi:thymidylate synthase (FAD)